MEEEIERLKQELHELSLRCVNILATKAGELIHVADVLPPPNEKLLIQFSEEYGGHFDIYERKLLSNINGGWGPGWYWRGYEDYSSGNNPIIGWLPLPARVAE